MDSVRGQDEDVRPRTSKHERRDTGSPTCAKGRALWSGGRHMAWRESPGPFGSCLCLESGWKESEERLVQAGFPKASEGSGGDLGG